MVGVLPLQPALALAVRVVLVVNVVLVRGRLLLRRRAHAARRRRRRLSAVCRHLAVVRVAVRHGRRRVAVRRMRRRRHPRGRAVALAAHVPVDLCKGHAGFFSGRHS